MTIVKDGIAGHPLIKNFRNDDLITAIGRHQAGRGGAHRAGTLTSGPLRVIESYLRDYFRDRPFNTVETGCGASTILFAHYAQSHLAFCYDDRAEENSSVEFATSFPEFNAHRVEWVFGPTQQTIFRRPLREQVDLILIDGPHGYPFPELEYYAFYPWLKPEGVLILDDIHIPTIRNLYDFLRQDDMFYPHQVVGTTAFLIRSKAPALNREGDDWWLQRYNIQRFPIDPAHRAASRLQLPFSISYERGHLAQLGSAFERGFIPLGGRPTTEGNLAMMRLALDAPPASQTIVEIDVECVAPEHQPEAGFETLVNLTSLGGRRFSPERTLRLSVNLEPWEHPVIDIQFRLWGQKPADAIPGLQTGSIDRRNLGLILKKISARPATVNLPGGDEIARRQGAVVSFKCQSRAFRFFVDDPDDSIQAQHEAGRFYESEELGILRRHVEGGISVLDVGARGGNHAVYFERILGASKVIPIEPLHAAIERLHINAALNQLERTELGHLGTALGPRQAMGALAVGNAARRQIPAIVESPSGTIPIQAGDHALDGHGFGLIRIDAPGSEIGILEGLRETIQRSRPVLLVKVWAVRRQELEALLRDWGYRVADEHRRADADASLVLKHASA